MNKIQGVLKERRNIWPLCGMAVGILAVLIGLIFLFGFKDEIFYGSADSIYGGTTRLGTATFGADFYTEIYESTTFAGNAVKGVYELLSTCFGMLFLLMGAIDICAFGSKLTAAEIQTLSAEAPAAETRAAFGEGTQAEPAAPGTAETPAAVPEESK